MPDGTSPPARHAWGFVALLGVVALATAVGGLGGGQLGRMVGVWRGHVGDDLIFDALGWGLVGSVALSIATGIVAAPFCRFPRWVGLLVAVACMALWVSLFVGPWHVF
ncbi:MAG: hypothetical protein ACYDBQ_03920 [Thermoplasmatota archaeon]